MVYIDDNIKRTAVLYKWYGGWITCDGSIELSFLYYGLCSVVPRWHKGENEHMM